MSETQKKENQGHRYSTVLSPLKIGPVQLPNRVAFPAWQLNYAHPDGSISDKLLKYYTDLAHGGCGLIFTGAAVVNDEGVPFDKVMGAHTDDMIPGLKKLFSAIKDAGAVPAIQIVHYGRQSSTSASGQTLLAPSAIPCPVMSQYDPEYKVKEMTMDDIARTRAAFITAALRAVDAGVEVVEVHVCHGYLLAQFLSPYSNKRTDAYGGNLENRIRLIVEILDGIQAGLMEKNKSDRVAVTVRISGDEFVSDGLKPSDFSAIIPIFEKSGIDMISVSAGVYESMERIVPPKTLGMMPHVEIAEQIKPFSLVPICAVGSILSLEAAEAVISEGKADLCAMGRAQMADPALVNKSAQGREAEINECIHCNSCTFWTTGDPEVYCAVNPDYQKPA